MIQFPFHKFLYYLIVISRFDKEKYAEGLDIYLPAVAFDSVNEPYNYIADLIKIKSPLNLNVQKDYSKKDFFLYLKHFEISELHSTFNSDEFHDLLFDTDLRRKIDGMALSPVFRDVEIYREFNHINEHMLKVYLDCFANFKAVQNKLIYITNYIQDKQEKSLLTIVSQNTSKKYLRIVIGLRTQEFSPKELIEEALNVANTQLRAALLNKDDAGMERWTKIQVAISEKLHKLGAGTKSDLDELMEALQAEKDFQDPTIYTIEDLERMAASKNQSHK